MKKINGLSETDAEIIIAMAQCNMNIQGVADKLHYARTTVDYHLREIHKATGLNPKGFFELIELVQIAQRILGDDYE